MKKTKPTSKLTLSRQTVRVLTSNDLRAAVGGLCPVKTNDSELRDCLACVPELGGTCR